MSGPADEAEASTRSFVADATATFAGVLLFVAGLLDILQGGSALADDHLYGQGSDYVYGFNLDAWGVVHLVIGVLSLAVAVGIVLRTGWGQVTGMIVAGLAILTNFAFLPLYPWWSIVVIAFYAVVIWALSVQMRHDE